MTAKIPNPQRQVAYLAFVNRENSFTHHAYSEEMKQYILMQAGDPSAVEESGRMMRRDESVGLSTDPVRNMKYLFVANITIATRFAIEGGMDGETAYNTSDLYIRKMDTCHSVQEVLELHQEMFAYFTERMSNIKHEKTYAKPIRTCMIYIDAHLHMPIRIRDLAAQADLTPSYLSALFKKETGLPVSDYVLRRRIDTARNMLRYSDYSASQISEILAFSSQSYFIRCFKKNMGMTPNEYRQRHYDKSLAAAHG
ncbi:MAG: helix-turn-helix domain-containing protein [Clostridia bacterium]|nr:helix-turn-helix domain-containing protein [Clostridia bacterium]